jgi:thiamine biosynthesis lipoprotein
MSASFACFGGTCTIHADARITALARTRLLEWHQRFSRFLPDSELSRLNRDPRPAVPVSPTMAKLVEAIIDAGEATGGLVDGTLAGEIVAAGYATDLAAPVPLDVALALAPLRRPAGPSALGGWKRLRLEHGVLHRPPGVEIDGGGLAKGLFADLIAVGIELAPAETVATLQLSGGGAARIRFALPGGDAPRFAEAGHRDRRRALPASAVGEAAFADGGAAARSRGVGERREYAIDCAGDLRISGPAREVHVANPFGGEPVHTFMLGDAGIATSGIGRRSWLADGLPAHHLLDPATGRPAFTGIVQATAIAPTAAEAEWRAKAAVLAGPENAEAWLPHGGALVLDDETTRVIAP